MITTIYFLWSNHGSIKDEAIAITDPYYSPWHRFCRTQYFTRIYEWLHDLCQDYWRLEKPWLMSTILDIQVGIFVSLECALTRRMSFYPATVNCYWNMTLRLTACTCYRDAFASSYVKTVNIGSEVYHNISADFSRITKCIELVVMVLNRLAFNFVSIIRRFVNTGPGVCA